MSDRCSKTVRMSKRLHILVQLTTLIVALICISRIVLDILIGQPRSVASVALTRDVLPVHQFPDRFVGRDARQVSRGHLGDRVLWRGRGQHR